MANPTNYTIGWICAISIEYVAAQTFLDIKHGIPERLSPGDYNNYTLGSIAGHDVVIAVLPKGEYGTASAAVVATHMLRSFPNVRIGLMVGIGGGAPSAKNDIRLGDIVVSSPFDGQGGVVQYDFGKAIQGQIFQHTRFLNQPPMILQTAVSGLISQYEIEGHNLHEAVCEVLERKPKLRGNYQRPDLNTDRLYHSNIIHPPDDAQMSNCAVACGNNPSVLISRRDRTDEEDNPRIHYGLVASSNQLMKNALTRDKLAAEKGVLCFEMEAAGLMNHFPCLVIRGICDYSDSHKNDKWQGYAAMAAAAYAKDLLRQIVPSQVEAETKIVDILDGIQGSIDTMSGKVDSIVDIQRDQKQQTIHDWLHPMDYSAQQNDFIASRQEGSGKWLLNSKQFRQWSNQETPILFCPGIPGAGKTIATSIVINHLQEKFHGRQDVGIAFVYFNFHQHIEHNMIGLFACLLRQLSFQTGSMDEVMSLYSYHKPRRSRPSFQEILDSLKKTITSFSSTFILIDALDECRLPDGVLKLLAEIFELQAIVGFSLFATSRFIPEITSDFERRGASYIEIRASDDDMLSYLNRGLSRLPSFVLRDHELQEKVKSAVTKAADGMFLLAKLHLYSLEDKINPRQLGIALNSLPKGSDAYNQVYEDAMDRIQSQRQGLRDLSFQVIAWIVHAQRPLTRSEMQHALATTNDALLLDLDNITEVELLVSVCAGLVTVDVTSNTIRLVHHTAAEYFDRTRTRWFPNAQDDITHTCVTYLSFQPFECGPSSTPKDFKARLQTNALYEYAARFWGYHAHNSSIQGSKSILDFLKSTSKVSACSQAMIYTELGYYEDIEMNGVHLAARFGLCKSMLALLERQHDVNCKDKSFGRAPLSWAIESGYGPVVEILLDHNADIHTKDKSGRTPLIWASEKGFEAIVRLLLDRNADARPKDRDFGRTSLLWAAKNGHEAVVRLLLDKSAKNVNSRDKSGRTALSWAARNGHSVVVKLLLDNGADTELRDEFNRTPLCWAAMNGYSEVVTLLLDKRASTEEVDQFGRTPLFWASMNGHLVVVELLLDSNAGFAYRDDSGRTSLSWALEKKHVEVAKLILQKSVAVSYKDRTGRTLLSSAAEYGDNAVVKFMLKNNTAVDSADQDGRTPLSWAAAKGNLSTVKALLASNADPRRGDIFGRTPHAWAAFQDEKAVADLLYCEEFHRQSLEETSDRGLSNGPCDICQRTPIRVSNLYWQFQGIFT